VLGATPAARALALADLAAALLHGASKLLNANAWSKEVNRRVKASR